MVTVRHGGGTLQGDQHTQVRKMGEGLIATRVASSRSPVLQRIAMNEEVELARALIEIERANTTERMRGSLDWLCHRVVTEEEARDGLLNILGLLCILTSKSLNGETTMTEEVWLRQLIDNALREMGYVIERKATEQSNLELSKFTDPTIAHAYARLE